MNCNLVTANDYGGLLDDIKKLSTKSWLLLEKEATYQFDLSLVELELSFPGMKKAPDKLNFLSYQENVDLFSWKYKFYNIPDNQIKDCKIFSHICNLKIKALSLKILKKQENIVLP